jgi:hypothetical protein
LLGQLAQEFGPKRVAPVAFHVDYFNDPWKDPFSDPLYSQREMQYSELYTRAHNIDNSSYLYLTPLLMIDGRVPMVASNDDSPAKARAAIREALRQPAELAIDASIQLDARKSQQGRLHVSIDALKPAVVPNTCLLEVVLCEDGLTTQVNAGELKGRSYRGSAVARHFEYRTLEIAAGKPAVQDFDLTLRGGQKPEQTAVVVFVQDEATGRVIQSRRVAWSGEIAAR